MITALELPATLDLGFGRCTLRAANLDDLVALVMLLADDEIAPTRGDVAADVDQDRYRAALQAIIDDPNDVQLVVTGDGEELLATTQLTVLPNLARRGANRLQIETVRVASSQRSSGVGTALFEWILQAAAPAVGAALVQLTSDERRFGARRFYERLGFKPSHTGFKYELPTG